MFMAEIENLKIYNSDTMFRKLSFFYELGGFFSPHLQALDFILHEENSFITKSLFEELKKIFKPHKIVKQIVTAFWILTDVKPKRKSRASGGVVVDHFTAFQSLIINQNNFLGFLKNMNIYGFKSEQVKKAMNYLQKIEERAQNGIQTIFNSNQGVFQLYLWVKACVSVHIILNPLNFISNEYINMNFGLEEIRQIEIMFQCLEKWRNLYSIKLHCSRNQSSLRNIVEHWEENYLDEESLNFIRIARSVSKIPEIEVSKNKTANDQALIQFYHSFDIFCRSFFFNAMSKFEPIPEYINVPQSAKHSRNNNRADPSLSSNYMSSYNTKQGIFGCLDKSILAEHVFFFLDLPDLCKSMVNVNSNWNKAYKTHLNARIYLLSEETKYYEEENIDIVDAIRHKRIKYYSDYELDPPRNYAIGNGSDEGSQKAIAIQMLNSFSYNDVSNLRRINCYSKIYEIFCAPLVILWGLKPERKATADGKVHISYWKTAFKIFNDQQFLPKIRDFKLESISQRKFEEIERFIRDERFQIAKAEKINKWLSSLVSWSKGVYLFHQYLREYALSSVDRKILTSTEKKFALMMDQLWYRNFKMLR
jgi:hypothetical protein